MEEDEKGAKLLLRRRAARTQMLTVLMGVGCLLTLTSILTVKQLQEHHSPKTRGGANANSASAIRKSAAVEQETKSNLEQQPLPVNSIYRLSVKDANGVLQSLQRYAGMVTLVVNTACK
jgi:hypothetical protein